jgi:hypothetical protein
MNPPLQKCSISRCEERRAGAVYKNEKTNSEPFLTKKKEKKGSC